jgi:hypothetical protein
MKKNNLFHLLALALALTTSSNALALTKTGEDTLTIAKPGSSSTKKLKLGTGEIRFDTSDSKLKFAHDGLNFKNVGSGSGSGSGGKHAARLEPGLRDPERRRALRLYPLGR